MSATDRAGLRETGRMDGKLVLPDNGEILVTDDKTLGYRQLQWVEQAWRQIKSGLRLCTFCHHATYRIHAHIGLSVVAQLLEAWWRMVVRIHGAISMTISSGYDW